MVYDMTKGEPIDYSNFNGEPGYTIYDDEEEFNS